VVEHRKAGTPQWIRTTTNPVLQPELQLEGLEPGWRYQFRVTAQNAADLLSDPGELSQPLTVARAYRPATMAPQFSQELQDMVALENEKVICMLNVVTLSDQQWPSVTSCNWRPLSGCATRKGLRNDIGQIK
jgi:hypothetical protein